MATQFKTVAGSLALMAIGMAAGWAIGTQRAAAPGVASPHAAASATTTATTTTTVAAGAASAPERKVLYWYDPMVPTQRFDRPGKSPFMDMQLVPRYADEGDASAAGTLAVSTAAQQALGLRLASVEMQQVGAAIEAAGTVQLNERDIAIVQARTAGYVERVYARAPGDVVAAGAPLVDVMNPEWLGAQHEFLAVKATGDSALAQAARQRLLLLGMPAALVEQLERSGRPQAVQTITAPAGGLISELMVRAGMTLAPGMTLARINGLGTVWLEAAVPEAQAAAVMPGQGAEARFAAWPGEVVKGRVAAVLPELNRETRTLRVRIELPNAGGRLKPGLYAQVSLRGTQRETLVLPAEAVIRTGRRALVYLAEPGGRFRPVEVDVGEQVDERIVVRRGLVAGQQVVASGQFLLDSEASLQGVLPVAAAAAAEYRTRGIVQELDADTVTLEHEPVPALKWPGMTMPFKVLDRSLLKGMKKGQAVDFAFTRDGDDWRLTSLRPAAAAASGAAR